MPIIILFLAIAIVVSIAGMIINPNVNLISQADQKQEEQMVKTQQAKTSAGSKTGSSGSKSATQPQTSDSGLNTYIIYNSASPVVFSETNTVFFDFDAVIPSSINKNDVYFETKIEGLDSDWQTTNEKKREVIFPGGSKSYTFQVRARTSKEIDPSPAQRTITINVSPYLGKIEISQVDRTGADFNPSLIKLTANINQGASLNITGWKLKASRGSFLIPGGTKTYQLSSSGNINLYYGDGVYISSASGPFGSNPNAFRLNRCMGYLKSSYNFKISVPSNCPTASPNSFPSYLQNSCKDYILTLESCKQATYQGLESYKLTGDDTCRDYIDSNFTYGGCLSSHSSDSDFTENEWHIYTNRQDREIMDINSDTVYLYDQNGLFIDKYCYGSQSCS
ncbi:MAG: hypothetical protein PHW72_01860 [Candidatus Pacebacteria bacterium]|nr:hypothetical protein [Candidatus Paceibacterota bacterium]